MDEKPISRNSTLSNEDTIGNITKNTKGIGKIQELEKQESEISYEENFSEEKIKPKIINVTEIQIVENLDQRKEINDDTKEIQDATHSNSVNLTNTKFPEKVKNENMEFSMKSNSTDIVYIIYLNENA